MGTFSSECDHRLAPHLPVEKADRHDPISERREIVSLPTAGESFLCFLLNKEEQVYVIGDLAEEFCNKLSTVGRFTAVVWFYQQVATSSLPLAGRLPSKIAHRIFFSPVLDPISWLTKKRR